MSVERSVLVIQDLEVEVLRKKIRNLHLRICPSDGCVRVSAFRHLDEEAIRRVELSRLRDTPVLTGRPVRD